MDNSLIADPPEANLDAFREALRQI